MTDYQELLTSVFHASKMPIMHGKTIVFIWKNQAHLLEWYSQKNQNSESVKIVTLPSEFLPMLSTGTQDRNDVCILAIGFGTKEDYSDTRCIFHMAIIKNE